MFDLLLNAEQRTVVDSLRDYLEIELPLNRFSPSARPRDVAAECAALGSLGWFGIGLPESVGGAGLGLLGEVLVQRECGRHLLSPTVLAIVLGAHVAFLAGSMQTTTALVSGQMSAALALSRSLPRDARSTQILIPDWNGRDPVVAWTDRGMGLFPADAVEEVQAEQCLDDSVTLHTGLLDGRHPLYWVASEEAPLSLRAQVLLAAVLTGLAQQACDITVEYVKVRKQFGRPVGSFQSVKHRCADMALRWRTGWCQTAFASMRLEAAGRDADFQASAAKLIAAQAAHANGRAAIQLHGAIGFQAEYSVHWLMKRAHLYDQAGGSIPVLERRLMSLDSTP